MKRNEIKKALVAIGYTNDSIKSLMCGRALPSMSKAIKLKNEHAVPLDVWDGIKSYLKNDTKDNTSNASTKPLEKVS